MRALAAVEQSLITTMRYKLTNGTVFEDLGADHLQRTHEISQLPQLGYGVELKPNSHTGSYVKTGKEPPSTATTTVHTAMCPLTSSLHLTSCFHDRDRTSSKVSHSHCS
jgi:hypothetical protein